MTPIGEGERRGRHVETECVPRRAGEHRLCCLEVDDQLILVGRPASHLLGCEYLRQLVNDRSIALDRHNGPERKDTGWPLTPRYWWWAQVQRACSWRLS